MLIRTLLPTLVAMVLAADSRLAAAEPPLAISLVSEVTSITPGQPFYVGLALHHGPGYHTYWKSGGIVGVPTSIRWTDLPKGFRAGEIEWPAPELTKMFNIVCQGYERDVVLPIKITPPAKLTEGSNVKLVGTASWMVCNRECNPGFCELSIELPVKNAPQPALHASWHQRFEQERARPIQESKAWTAKATQLGNSIVLELSPHPGAASVLSARELRFFTEDGSIDSDKPQAVLSLPSGGVRFELALPDHLEGKAPRHLAGVITCKSGWLADGSIKALRVLASVKKE